MAVVLTGATGFVGGHLRSMLGTESRILLGRRKPELADGERWVHVDLSESVSPGELEGGKVLCHLAYSMQAGDQNIPYNRRLLDAVNACSGIERVILMSSVSVYGGLAAQTIDEESGYQPTGEYAKTKLACEAVWREGLRGDRGLTVLRPTEVIGPGGKGLRTLIRDAVEWPITGAVKRAVLYHRPLHYVAVSNVVAAILFCLRRSQTADETFVISDDHQPENKSYAVMQDTVRSISGKPPLPGPVMPRSTLRLLGTITGRALESGRVFSSRKLHSVGFEDAVPLYDEVRRVMRSVGVAA